MTTASPEYCPPRGAVGAIPRGPSLAEMRQACQARDVSFDGLFVLAVSTTGIFCRPSCPARRPRPDHMRFFPSLREARGAGFRPCQRRRPLEADGQCPTWLARVLVGIRNDAKCLLDKALRNMGLDPGRVRRFFKRRFGITFQAYGRRLRMGTALTGPRNGEDLTMLGHDASCRSPSGFRSAFARTFGALPGRGRSAGCIWMDTVPSPVGLLTLGADEDALRWLRFGDSHQATSLDRLQRHLARAVVPGRNRVLQQARFELEEYFAGRRRDFTVPVAYGGTPFQHQVWDCLRQIPYGQTISYQALASRVGRPSAQRAVGMANGSNPIAIVVPCHRVVNKGGKLGGYGGGLWRKQILLDLERGVTAAASGTLEFLR